MKITHLLLLAALLALAGCSSDGVTRPPATRISFFNAAPHFGQLGFLREEKSESSGEFGSGIPLSSIDSGPYDFHLDVYPTGGAPLRADTVTADLSPDEDNFFLGVESGGQLNLILATRPRTQQSASNARITLIHGHGALGAIDMYVTTAGMPLSGIAADGTVSLGSGTLDFEKTPGTYRIYLTPAGDPNTVLFESIDIDLFAGADAILVISDSGEQPLTDLALFEITGSPVHVLQLNLGAAWRAVQASVDRLERDIYIDDTTSGPAVSALPFGQFSDFQNLTQAAHPVIMTPVASPGTEEASTVIPNVPGRHYMAIFASDSTNGPHATTYYEDLRHIRFQATVRFLNLSTQFDFVYGYITDPGTDIATVFPTAQASQADLTARVGLLPGSYELTIWEPVTSTVLAGPIPVTLADEGLYGFMLTDNISGSTVDVTPFYDPLP